MNACLNNNAVFSHKNMAYSITEAPCSAVGQVSVKTSSKLGNGASFRVILLFKNGHGSSWALLETFNYGKLY